DLALGEDLERRRAVLRLQHLARLLEDRADGGAHALLVVDDEHGAAPPRRQRRIAENATHWICRRSGFAARLTQARLASGCGSHNGSTVGRTPRVLIAVRAPGRRTDCRRWQPDARRSGPAGRARFRRAP